VSDASAPAIAAVEKHGGAVRLVYYNRLGLRALLAPEKFRGACTPVPCAHCVLIRAPVIPRLAGPPTPRLLALYKNAAKRGYLCSPEDLAKARAESAEAPAAPAAAEPVQMKPIA
jgi:large subunit ribosomal protein L15